MCRSRVNHDFKNEKGEYQQEGRFNFGVQTLSIPNLLWSCIRETSNWNELSYQERIDKVKDKIISYTPLMQKSMEWRYNQVKKLKPKNVPILFMAGGIARLKAEDSIEPFLKSTQSSISYGYIGIGDVLEVCTDRQHSINDEIGLDLGLQLIKTISEEANKIKENTGLPVSVYGTPAESSIYTYFVTDVENYGDIIPQWLKDRGYYTNSFHYPSEQSIDAFEKIKAESNFHKYSNGGNITYVENSGKLENWQVAIELMRWAYECGIEYFGVNTVSNKCFECGYVGDIPYDNEKNTYVCPNCNNSNPLKLDITLRCCGLII